MRPQVGQVINNKYRLLRLVGDGGMGSVYEARHEVLGTSVALKFLHHELSRRAGLVQRFLQEARVSAQVQSPHVVRVTDVDQAPSGAYIVMEYLEGKTLQTLYEELYRGGLQLSYADALEYAMQMLDGAEAAHKQGVVHRDLKPDNVMITADTKGRPLLKLLDFGIAKLKAASDVERGLTRPGVIMGTPEYMAPEQAFSADAVDARADIFSLGVMIFEMLAGRRPVGGEEPQQIASAYLSGRIAQLTDLAPNIAPELGAAVHRAMAALARDRWQSVTDFRDAIEPFAFAAKAPSAMPRGSLSNPEISLPPATPAPAAITPPATNVTGNGAASLPNTFPPAGRVAPDATNPAEPPVMSSPKQLLDATPVGGFALSDVDQLDGRPRASVDGQAPAHVVPPTKSVAPYVPTAEGPVVDHASTAFAAPYVAEPIPAIEHSPRPSGTAIGEPLFALPPVPPAPPIAITPDPAYPPLAPSAYAPSPSPAQAPARSKRKGGFLSSLPAILLLAAGVAGAVVGGVYVVQTTTKTEERDEPAVTSVPSATVASDPPPETTAAAPTPPTATIAPKPPIQIQPRPQPRPSSWPPPKPAPSSQPSSRPGVIPLIPPIIIPSTFPLSFPFPSEPPPRDQPRTRPDLPPRDRLDEPRKPRYEPHGVPPRPAQEPWGAYGPERYRPNAMPGARPRRTFDGY